MAYGKDGLDVRVCVMNIEFHIALHTENVHILVDEIGSCRICSKMLTTFEIILAFIWTRVYIVSVKFVAEC